MSGSDAIPVSFLEDVCYRFTNLVCRISIVDGYSEVQVTGFLVGRDFVLSVYHVFHGVIESNTKRAKIFAIFGFKGKSLTVGQKQYFFYNTPAYINPELDVIILHLKPDTGLPTGCVLTKESLSSHERITFVGHPYGEPQKISVECPILTPEHPIVVESSDYFRRQYGPGGFQGMNDPHSVLVQSRVGGGAAGSPGFVQRGNTSLACMLTMAYPTFRAQLPPRDLNYTFEKAVTMDSLYSRLKIDNPRLCFSIF
ncbi:uncharacterized protein LOC134239832 [Saccostrea cucullata]|uniref:uncharacterized protein LOC134239832 n=1 Tax=Saccostrea cuccullata TaxID=36930 RepID=UPI002ED08CC3